MRRIVIPLTVGAGILLWGELVHRRASRRGLGSAAPTGGREAVVVLGFRNRGTRANYLNRYRVRAGLRSQDPDRHRERPDPLRRSRGGCDQRG